MKPCLTLLRLLCGTLATALLGLVPAAAGAVALETAPAVQVPADVVLRFVSEELARSQPDLRAEISVGELDPHLRLAACGHMEAFLRPGGRLWGRSFVGLRCLQRSGWSVSVPVTVRLFGPALVATQPLPALQAIPASALRSEEIDVTREPGGVVTKLEQLEDRNCSRSLEPGQPIPLNALRVVPAVGQGEPVKLVGVGAGFSIATDGTALATAASGELVRVRTDSGRTVSGIARKGRVVELSF